MPKRSLYARRWRSLCGSAALAMLLWAAGGTVSAQTGVRAPCAACLVPVLSPPESLLVSAPLNGLEVLIRTSSSRGPGKVPVIYAPEHVRQAREAVRAAGGRPGVLVGGIESSAADAAAVTGASRIVVDVTSPATADDRVLFQIKTRLTELRAASPDAALGLAGPVSLLTEDVVGELAPYLDFVARPGTQPPPFPGIESSAAIGLLYPVDAMSGGKGEPERWLVRLPADALDAQRVLQDIARAAPALGEGLIPGGTAEVRCGGRVAATYLDPASLDTVAIVADCPEGALTVTPAVSGVVRVPLAGGGAIIRVPAGEGAYTEDIRVVGARTLTVREIIARHQAAAARQAREVRHLISTGSMTLTFEAPGFPAPMAITSETVIFTAPDRVELEQRDIRVNGIAFREGGVPRLPLLEPERVASPPLAIALTEVYRYTLAGRAEVNGVPAYVIGFEPADRARSLFSGRAWIAADSFAMLKVSAVQTGLRGPIVSSEQVDEFRREREGVWLLARSDVRQIYEGAGHRTPIHRVLAIDRHEINPEGFAERRATAYASRSIMLRDTPEGFRYLQRERGADGVPTAVPAVTGPAAMVRTVVAGVIIDPNITRPLPFAGLSYVDFDLLGTGAQVNAFFGGTYGQLAASVPSVAGTRWQIAGRAFGIASSYNDRAFVEGREIYEANIAQRPAHASVWLLRPLTPRLSLRLGYDFDYTHFGRSGSTAPGFVVPAHQSAHGVRVAADAQWSGWTATAWWVGARRAGWRPWGDMTGEVRGGTLEPFDPRQADYHRIGAGVGRSLVVSPRLVGRVDASWMGGQDLDRFSRYTFGSFDNRLRGYPSALIRYDQGAVLRTSAAWAAGRLLRLDGFFDTAYVRDPGFGREFRNYTGLGAAAEMPAPFGTLVAVEWGYGFQGINVDGRRGTHVIRVSGYKMF